MPEGILPNEGIGQQLESIVKLEVAGIAAWQLVLFVNDIVPDADVTFADLVEASFDGYSRATLERALWLEPTVDGGCAVSVYGTEPLQWYNLGTDEPTVYGYALIDSSSEVIRFIQRFEDDDIQPLEPGGRIVLLPRYTLTSAACPEA